MSIAGSLTQISSSTLTRVKETPSLLELLQRMEPVDDEAPKVDNFYGLSSEHISLLRDIHPNPEAIIGEWTLEDLIGLEDWKADYPKDFDKLKTKLYEIIVDGRAASFQIVMEGRVGTVAPFLDLDVEWHIISYIFTGSSSMEILPFLVDDTGDDLRVNAILCGQRIDEDSYEEGYHRYLEVTQVREIAVALSQISETTVCQRIEQGWSTQPKVFRHFQRTEEKHEEILELCLEVKAFYNDAMVKGNAMLIDIV